MVIIIPGVTGPPPETPPEPVVPRLGLWLQSQSGDLFDLIEGPAVVAPGITGLGTAKPEHWWDVAPALDGQTYQGMRTPAREVFVPVTLTREDGTWLEHYRRFMRECGSPDRVVWLRVMDPEGETRSLQLRYDDGGDPALEVDPVWRQHQAYPMTYTAGHPFWLGGLEERWFPYRLPTTGSRFPGPPFTILPVNSTTNAAITNPGDVDAFALWRIYGPFTEFTVGVGERLVSGKVTKGLGEWIEVDMDPRDGGIVEGVTDDDGVDQYGVDRLDVLTAWEYAPIPPETDVALTTTIIGGGAGSGVRLQFYPNYWRAM